VGDFPASHGHDLIFPQRHTAPFFELTSKEPGSMPALRAEMRQILTAEQNSVGFDSGFNAGAAAAIVRACMAGKTEPAASQECSWAAIPTCC
jgi:diadenosine tetraphosphate (Ap4A) HIT family hydrolase